MAGRQVFVLGAGFTRAFYPKAPLMIDDYGGADLIDRFKRFTGAKLMIESEIQRNDKGSINIERMMTRLESPMPYDDFGRAQEHSLLLVELNRAFLARLAKAKTGDNYEDDLSRLAIFCVNREIDCITFNYDDFLDQKLYGVANGETRVDVPHWHPDGGYGFFCRPADTTVEESPVYMERNSMHLLKLHGSMNWRAIRGRARPYSVDAIVHLENWYTYASRRLEEPPSVQEIESHLNPEPLIIPPVLVKSALSEQLWLSIVWSKAFGSLREADKVTFIGYSLPDTDIAAAFLFGEAIRPDTQIEVVSYSIDGAHQDELARPYLLLFPWLSMKAFDFRGALAWCRDVVA